MKNRIIAIIVVLLFFISKSYSQGHFLIQAGTSVPVSDFASVDENNENALGAATGISAGCQYIIPFSSKGLSLFAGFDIDYNWMKFDYRYKIRESFKELNFNVDVKYYKFINIPFTLGLNYTYYSDEKLGVFAKAGFVFNYFRITDMTIKFDGYTVVQKMDMGKSPGYRIGAGIILNKKITLALDYTRSGKYEMAGQIKISGYMQDLTYKGSLDILTFTTGYLF